MKNYRLRFGLSTLMGLVACSAVVCWVCVLWPRLREHWAVQRLARAIEAGDESAFEQAFDAVREFRAGQPAVPVLISSLNHDEWNLRRDSARSLEKVGEIAVPELIAALGHEDEKVRGWAAEALGNIGPKARPAIPLLIEMVKNEMEIHAVREDAVCSLLEIDSDHAAIVPILIDAVKRDDDRLAWTLAHKLGRRINVQAVPTLITALASPDGLCRKSAVTALGATADRVPTVIPKIIQTLQDADQDGTVRAAAAHALSRVASSRPDAVSTLIAFLSDEDWRVRAAAAQALGGAGHSALEAVEALIGTLKDEDTRVGAAAAHALGGIGLATVISIPPLTQAANEDDNRVPTSVGNALLGITQQGDLAVPALIDALAHEDQFVRWAAAAWLGRFARDGAPEAKSVIPALTKALEEDQYFHVRRDAADALGRIGPAAQSAVPALVKALKDGDSEVRYQAAEALHQIGPEAASAAGEP